MHDGLGPMSNWCADLRDALEYEWAQDREAYPLLSLALAHTAIAAAGPEIRDQYRCGLDAGAAKFSANSCRAGLERWFGPTTLGRDDWRDTEDALTEAGREIHQLLLSHKAEIVLLTINMGSHEIGGARCERIVECRQCSWQVIYHAPSAVEVARIAMPADDDWPEVASQQLTQALAGCSLAA